MDKVKQQLDALFEVAGRKYEVLTYQHSRAPHDRTAAELALLTEMLVALAPFKEKLTNIENYDFYEPHTRHRLSG